MSSTPDLSLKGVHPPVPTPFDADGELDRDALEANLGRLIREPLAGFVIGGSNGEFFSLTVEERVCAVRTAREVIPFERLLIAGSGMESTRETIALTARMAEAGADAVLVVTPSYYTKKMDARALMGHYLQVADASPIPVILYNVPANTGIDIPTQTVIDLAAHPKVVGIKDSSGDVIKVGYMVHHSPQGFQVLVGSGGMFLAGLAVGAVGCVSALANLLGAKLVEVMERFEAGDLERARAIQGMLIGPNYAVTTRFGVPGLKAAMDMMGFYGGPVRAPLLPLTEEAREAVRREFQQAGLL